MGIHKDEKKLSKVQILTNKRRKEGKCVTCGGKLGKKLKHKLNTKVLVNCEGCRAELRQRTLRYERLRRPTKLKGCNGQSGSMEESFVSDSGPMEPALISFVTDPTTFNPGSEEKVEVLASRYENSQPLWHPQDQLGACYQNDSNGYVR